MTPKRKTFEGTYRKIYDECIAEGYTPYSVTFMVGGVRGSFALGVYRLDYDNARLVGVRREEARDWAAEASDIAKSEVKGEW